MRGKSISRLQTITELHEVLEKFLAGQWAILTALVEFFFSCLGGKVHLVRFVDHFPVTNLVVMVRNSK